MAQSRRKLLANLKKARAARRRKAQRLRRKPRRRNVARRRRMRRRRSRRSFSGGIRRARSGIGNIFKSGIVGKAVTGIGAAAVTTMVLDRVAPQFSPIGSLAAGFIGGGVVGGAANALLSGGLGAIGGLIGGGQPQEQGGL